MAFGLGPRHGPAEERVKKTSNAEVAETAENKSLRNSPRTLRALRSFVDFFTGSKAGPHASYEGGRHGPAEEHEKKTSNAEAAETGQSENLRNSPRTLRAPRSTVDFFTGSKAGCHDDVMVLGADTAVVVDGEILGKPGDDQDARAMLTRLSGRSHHVMTGVSLRSASRELGALETTTVWFATLDRTEVEGYVGTGEGRDKAGAYAIQGRASRFIPRIDGSYSNVVGLPVALVNAMIARVISG